MKTSRVSILGCGWLGLPLAKHLVDLGCKVNGATTTASKLDVLKQANISPFLIQANPTLQGDSLEDFFSSDVLFLNIPFKRNLEDPIFYQQQIESVCSYLESAPINHLIFASSTSVYPSTIKEAREDSIFEPDNERSKVLASIEQDLLANKNFEATIIRFAGLYGGERKLGNFLSKRQNIKNGGDVVNLIHLDDCISIVTQIITEAIKGQIFNACSDEHPTRKELYTKAAIREGREPPVFDSNSVSKSKIVINDKIKKCLNYQFKHPSPLL